LLRPEPGEQNLGAEEVHVVWHPVGVAHNGFEGPLSEDRSTRQSYLGHALADIRQALCLSQWHERSVADAVLRQAAEFASPQVVLQLRLADEHNLEGGLAGRCKVCKQRQLLKGLAGQVLRLIDDERHIPALVELVPEELLQLG